MWTFNHGNAQFVYSGCNGGCTYGSSCQHKGGWYPGDFNGCTSDCYVSSQYRTDNQLGGGYFPIWGDWARLGTPRKNIWTRTDNYGLIDRMWAVGAKMWKWDMDSNKKSALDYNSFKTLTSGGMRFSPASIAAPPRQNVLTPGDVHMDEPSSVQVKVMIGDEVKVLETIPLEGNVGDPSPSPFRCATATSTRTPRARPSRRPCSARTAARSQARSGRVIRLLRSGTKTRRILTRWLCCCKAPLPTTAMPTMRLIRPR